MDNTEWFHILAHWWAKSSHKFVPQMKYSNISTSENTGSNHFNFQMTTSPKPKHFYCGLWYIILRIFYSNDSNWNPWLTLTFFTAGQMITFNCLCVIYCWMSWKRWIPKSIYMHRSRGEDRSSAHPHLLEKSQLDIVFLKILVRIFFFLEGVR